MTDEEMEALLNVTGHTLYHSNNFGWWIVELSSVYIDPNGERRRKTGYKAWMPHRETEDKRAAFNTWITQTDGIFI